MRHVAAGAAFLQEKNYDDARDALAFAETEGASLEEVRRLRRQIPGYLKAVGSANTAALVAPSSAIARTLRGSSANALTIKFATSKLRSLDLKAAAAGKQCDLLLVTFYVRMEDSMIRAIFVPDQTPARWGRSPRASGGCNLHGGLAAFGR